MKRSAGLIGALLFIAFVVVVVASIDLTRIGDALLAADYRLVPPMLLMSALGLLTRGLRWRLLLNGRLQAVRAFHISNVGYMLNALLPLRAGEVARVLLAARPAPPDAAIPVATTLSTILLERIIDMLMVFALLGVALAALPSAEVIEIGGATLAVGAGIGLISLIVIARFSAQTLLIIDHAAARVPVLQRFALPQIAARFLDGLSALTSTRLFISVLVWSVLAWLCSVIASGILLYAFFGAADWAVVMLFMAMSAMISTAAAAVSYTPAAVGPYHAGVVLALALTGFDQPEGAPIAFAIVLHVLNLGLYVGFGLWGVVQQSISLHHLLQKVRAFARDPRARNIRPTA